MSISRARRVCAHDAEAIAAIYAPFVVETAVSFETEAPNAAEMRKRIADIATNYPWLVTEDTGHVVGYAYASQHSVRAAYQWSTNVTVYLHAGYQGKGLGTRLYRVLFAVLKRQGFRSLYAGITLPNQASLALHQSMGMREVGVYRNVGFKFGAWRDVIWLGFSFDDDRPPSAPPIKFEALPVNDVDHLLDNW